MLAKDGHIDLRRPINAPSIYWPLNRWGPGNSLSAYAVNGSDPKLVADFAGVLNSGTPYFRKAGSASTFSGLFSYTGASNKTMTDSSGNLVWAPHNLFSHSAQFDNGAWSKTTATVTANTTTDPEGGATADTITSTSGASAVWRAATLVSGAIYTYRVWFKAGTAPFAAIRFNSFDSGSGVDGCWFNLSTGSAGTKQSGVLSSSITSAGDDWYLCTASFSTTTDLSGFVYFYLCDGDASYTVTIGRTMFAWGAHLYRSDLGGMVNNPDRGDSYVPTTSAAVYMDRRDNYRWNGSAWVRAGILLESAAATNLVVDSLGLSGLVSTGGGTVSSSATAAPFGTSATVKRVQGSAANDGAYISFTAGSGGTHVAAWYARSRTGAAQSVKTGLSGNVGPTTVLPANGDWTLVWGTAALGAGARDIRILQVSGNIDIDVAIPQAEFGSVPTSYIPTSGATATRAAETLTIAGSNMAASTTAMSFQIQGEINFDGVGFDRFWDWTADADNRIICFYQGASQDITALQEAANVSDSVARTALSATSGINEAFNIAARHTSGAVNIATDGTAATADVTPTALADLSSATFRLGSDGSTNVMPSMTIALFRQDDSDWTDAGIEEGSVTPLQIAGVPTISGTEREGHTLTATAAEDKWGVTSTTTWQWYRDGSAISGATSATYVLVDADVGSTITVTQTETAGSRTDSATSAATGTITSADLQTRSGDAILDRFGEPVENEPQAA